MLPLHAWGAEMVDADIPDFESIAGMGQVEQLEPDKKAATINARLTYIPDMLIGEKSEVRGLWLQTENESIVALARGDSGQVFICPGGPDHCKGEYIKAAEIKGKVLKMRSELGESRYMVEFSDNGLVYRIQKKNCLIRYPHGCLIHGFGWHDRYVYAFQRK
jgi:hypothetical protein